MNTVLHIDPSTLSDFCSQNGIKRLSLFGSQLKGTTGPDSDVDLLVEFEEGEKPGLIGLSRMEAELSNILGGRKVDLRTAEDLGRHFREEVVHVAEVVYNKLSDEDNQFIEDVSQDALAELWEDEQDDVWSE